MSQVHPCWKNCADIYEEHEHLAMELAMEFGPYNTVKLVYNDVRTGVTHWFALYKEGNQVVSGMPGMRIEVTTEHGPDYPGGFHCEASILEMIEVVQGYAYGQEWVLAL